MVNLTDQELNEWVSRVIMNWWPLIPQICLWLDRNPDSPVLDRVYPYASIPFRPCNYLDHTHLMEEKIMEMGEKIWEAYLYLLYDSFSKGMTTRILDPTYLAGCVNASARQRCEAAWLTFNGDKNES